MPAFRERLWPPLQWWLLAALGGAVVWVILWSALPWRLAAVVGVLLQLALAGALVAYAAEVVVDELGLRAGRATLPWSAIGPVVALDPAAAAHLRGPGADPAAYLLLRGYVRAAVRVEVADPADPTPYWYVSTRHPHDLASVLVAKGRGTLPGGPRGPAA